MEKQQTAESWRVGQKQHDQLVDLQEQQQEQLVMISELIDINTANLNDLERHTARIAQLEAELCQSNLHQQQLVRNYQEALRSHAASTKRYENLVREQKRQIAAAEFFIKYNYSGNRADQGHPLKPNDSSYSRAEAPSQDARVMELQQQVKRLQTELETSLLRCRENEQLCQREPQRDHGHDSQQPCHQFQASPESRVRRGSSEGHSGGSTNYHTDHQVQLLELRQQLQSQETKHQAELTRLQQEQEEKRLQFNNLLKDMQSKQEQHASVLAEDHTRTVQALSQQVSDLHMRLQTTEQDHAKHVAALRESFDMQQSSLLSSVLRLQQDLQHLCQQQHKSVQSPPQQQEHALHTQQQHGSVSPLQPLILAPLCTPEACIRDQDDFLFLATHEGDHVLDDICRPLQDVISPCVDDPCAALHQKPHTHEIQQVMESCSAQLKELGAIFTTLSSRLEQQQHQQTQQIAACRAQCQQQAQHDQEQAVAAAKAALQATQDTLVQEARQNLERKLQEAEQKLHILAQKLQEAEQKLHDLTSRQQEVNVGTKRQRADPDMSLQSTAQIQGTSLSSQPAGRAATVGIPGPPDVSTLTQQVNAVLHQYTASNTGGQPVGAHHGNAALMGVGMDWSGSMPAFLEESSQLVKELLAQAGTRMISSLQLTTCNSHYFVEGHCGIVVSVNGKSGDKWIDEELVFVERHKAFAPAEELFGVYELKQPPETHRTDVPFLIRNFKEVTYAQFRHILYRPALWSRLWFGIRQPGETDYTDPKLFINLLTPSRHVMGFNAQGGLDRVGWQKLFKMPHFPDMTLMGVQLLVLNPEPSKQQVIFLDVKDCLPTSLLNPKIQKTGLVVLRMWLSGLPAIFRTHMHCNTLLQKSPGSPFHSYTDVITNGNMLQQQQQDGPPLQEHQLLVSLATLIGSKYGAALPPGAAWVPQASGARV